jgi:hypothetical protein
MKNLVAAVILVASSLGVAHAVNIDLSDSECSVTGTNSLHLDGVSIGPNSWYLDLIWHPGRNIFRISDAGKESGTCPPLTGDWNVNFDWSCDGNPGTAVVSFYADGTFYSSGYSGTWMQDACAIEWVFDNGTVYWGDMEPAGDYVSGEMMDYNGSPGCWTGDRIGTAADRVVETNDAGPNISGE